jgi:two-component system cell cycle sensor histidine kinase/response regulator CckA
VSDDPRPLGPLSDEHGQVKRLSPQNIAADAATFVDLFAPILDSAGLVVYDWDMVRDNAVFAGAADRIFGSPIPESGGSMFFDRIHPDDRLRIHAAVWTTAAQPEAQGPNGAWGPGVTWRVVGFDNRVRTVRSASIIFADPQGRPIRLRGFFQDQTEQQAALDALKDAERYRGRIALASPHVLYVLDLASRRSLYTSRSFWSQLGYGPEESVDLDASGRSIYDVLHPDDQVRLSEYFSRWRNAGDGEVIYTEIRFRHKNGHWRNMRHADMVFERDLNGLATQLVGVAEDVTERRALEQQLLQAQKMESVGQLAGGVAHDFNNLLTVMQGYAREARALAQGDGALESLLSRLELTAARGASLTGQLLAFARRRPLDQRSVELNTWLKESAPLIRRALGEAVELHLRPCEEPLWVKADPVQLEQVLLNLSLNARDALPSGGHISLELEAAYLSRAQADARGMAEGAAAVLSVTDDGHGMAEEIRARALEPFFTTKPLGKGTGLGLSSCFGITKQHHGHLEIESEQGRGTRIRMYLPCSAPGVAAEAAGQAPPSAAPSPALSVLLTEDLDDLRELLERLLIGSGYQVVSARDGEEALQLAASCSRPFDVLVTDLGLPKVNGKELALQLRKRWPGLKVLATSGHPPNGEGPLTWLGPQGRFLSKPFHFDALLAELRALLGA